MFWTCPGHYKVHVHGRDSPGHPVHGHCPVPLPALPRGELLFPLTSIILTFVAASIGFPILSKNCLDIMHPTAPVSSKMLTFISYTSASPNRASSACSSCWVVIAGSPFNNFINSTIYVVCVGVVLLFFAY